MKHESIIPLARLAVVVGGAAVLALGGCGTQQADIGQLADDGGAAPGPDSDLRLDGGARPGDDADPTVDAANCAKGRDRSGCPCTPGDVRSCYSGPAGTEGVGPCKAGKQLCKSPNDPTFALGSYGRCEGETVPTATATCVADGGVVVDAPPDGKVGDTSCDLVQVDPIGNTLCALTSAGHVACAGQYPGDGTYGVAGKKSPFQWVAGLDGATAVVGNSGPCVLQREGTVMCWGQNESGQTGDGTTDTPRLSPVRVLGLTDAVEISAGTWHVCARRATGQVVCWGANMRGQLGDGTGHGATVDAASAEALHSSTPVAVLGITDAVELASGAFHTCARLASGSVVCWGQNNAGQVGDGTYGFAPSPPNPPSTTLVRASPVPVIGLGGDVVSIAGASWNTCAVRASGAVACWGGYLPPGTGAGGLTPTDIPGIGDAVTVAMGQFAGCVLRKGGVVTCWGDNDSCGLGNGTRSPASPTPPLAPPGNSPLGVASVVRLDMHGTDVGGVVDAAGCGMYWGLTQSTETSYCIATPTPVVMPP